MADTANFGWTKPTVGGSAGTWGTELNTLFDDADSDLNTVKTTADAAMPKAGGIFTGEIEIASERYALTALGNISGSVTVNLDNGDFQHGTVTGDITSFAISNWPASGKVEWLTLELTDGGAHTITWPAAIKWDGSVDPTLQASGVDVLVFYSRDNGTTIRGMHAYSFA